MRKEQGSKPSVTRHPLFALVVVLWFAALFGLASLTIRPALLEGLVGASGLDHILPMTAAPLGNTARLLIALAMTGIGGILGAIVARLVAKPASRQPKAGSSPSEILVQATTENHAQPALDPVNLIDEPADKEHEELARRSRQLAVNPDVQADEEQEQLAEPQILSVAELPLKSFDEVDGIWLHADDHDRTPLHTILINDTAPTDAGKDKFTQKESFEAPQADATTTANIVEDHATPTNTSILDAYVRRVNASAESVEADPAPAPSFTMVPQSELEALVPPIPNKTNCSSAQYVNTADRITSAPLESLSHVELLDRLAQAIARRQAEAARANDHPATRQNKEISSDEPAERSDSGLSLNTSHTAAPAVVQRNTAPLLANVSNDRTADNDILMSGFSALKSVIMQGSEASPSPDDGYKHTQTQQPVLAFPGLETGAQSAKEPHVSIDNVRKNRSSSDQTEQALQAALTTLRRMSGAA